MKQALYVLNKISRVIDSNDFYVIEFKANRILYQGHATRDVLKKYGDVLFELSYDKDVGWFDSKRDISGITIKICLTIK
jgi:hypothetical protein